MRDVYGLRGYVGSEQLVAPRSRRGLPSGLALTGAVYYTSQWPSTPFSFSHAGAANNLDAATQGVSNGHRL